MRCQSQEKVKVEEAVGSVLGHDITKIDPGRFKGTAFTRGQVIRPEDVPELLKLGKEHVYIWRESEKLVHENDAAVYLTRLIAGRGVSFTAPREGRVNLLAAYDGVLQIDHPALMELNSRHEVSVATRLDRSPVKEGEMIAGAKIVPLAISQAVLHEIEEKRSAEGIVNVRPFGVRKVGVVITGSEIYHGRIQDAFGPVLREKLAAYGCQVKEEQFAPDLPENIAGAIRASARGGAEMILVTGGMAVDADDVTPAGIRLSGAEVVSYGIPVLPGSLLMLAYLGDIPVLGLPGCVMHDRVTSFDLLLPRLLTGEKLDREDLIKLGHGGLCLHCRECVYPKCAFGKG